jgi:hypothetical protein
MSWNHSRHSYLVDLGSGIEIQQLEVSDLYENILLDPPFPETRFFEIEIEEERKDGQKIFIFQNICPVHAKRQPDWHILRFLLKRGGWTITEKIQSRTEDGEIQWIYTNDFALLFVSSGGRHDLNMLLSLMTDKLDAIAVSIGAGSRIPSQFENQLACKNAFGEIFTERGEGVLRQSILYQNYVQAFPSDIHNGNETPSGTGMGTTHGGMSVSPKPPAAAELSIDLDHIDDLQDLSWLTD